jgi:carboxyl-terminal processing protease
MKGVIPDITLPSIDDYLPYVGESSLPHALLWDEIKSTPFAGRHLHPHSSSRWWIAMGTR